MSTISISIFPAASPSTDLPRELPWLREFIPPFKNTGFKHCGDDGEISIHGYVKPVGGIYTKICAARKAGVKKVLIPKDNMESILDRIEGVEIVPVTHLREVFDHAFVKTDSQSHFRKENKPAIEQVKTDSYPIERKEMNR